MKQIKIFQTFDQLRDWVEQHTNQEEVEKNVKWFVAMFEAELIFESYKRKDLARALLDGTKPIDEEYVNEFLSQFLEDLKEEVNPIPDTISSEMADENGVIDLEENLKDFFNVS